MTGDDLRKLRNREVNNKDTPPTKNTKKTTEKIPAGKTSGNKTTVTTGRLSTSTSTPPIVRQSTSTSTPATQTLKLSESIQSLEKRVVALESLIEQLTTENIALRESVSSLQIEVSSCKSQLEQQQSSSAAVDNNISLEQQQLNTNIVIRGVDVKEDTSKSELLAVYEGIRHHLNVADVAEFTPVSLTVLPAVSAKSNSNNRPIRVQLQSTAAKVKFLQVRRAKKDIHHSDIGVSNSSRRPILISEHLTRANQELLFQARSLRGQNNFKFVWSSNGQILARRGENTKVIRISDTAHVNRLRSELNLEPLLENGQHITNFTVRNASNNP